MFSSRLPICSIYSSHLERVFLRCSSSEQTQKHTVGKVVCTTGFTFTKDNKHYAKYGVFWGKDDPRNVLEEKEDNITHVAAKLKAIIEALKQASKEPSIEKIVIKSDLKLNLDDLHRWNKREFINTKGTVMPNSELLRQLYSLVMEDQIEIDLQFDRNLFEYDNLVIKQIYQDKKWRRQKDERIVEAKVVKEKESVPHQPTSSATVSPPQSVSTCIKQNEDSTVSHTDSLLSTVPPEEIVYVGWKEEIQQKGEKEYPAAAYGVSWEKGPSSFHRLNMFPVTRIRAQMCGILEALDEAKTRGLKNVTVVTDAINFVRDYQRKWKTSNGTDVKNKYLYERIRSTSEGMNVSFHILPEPSSSPHFERAFTVAEDGLLLPLFRNNTSRQRKSWDEIVKEQEGGEIEKGMLRVRLFKQSSSFRGGIFWDRVEEEREEKEREEGGESEEGGEGEEKERDDCEEINNRMYDKRGKMTMGDGRVLAPLIHGILDTAASMGVDSIVIRTDTKRLAEQLSSIDIWNEEEYVNSQGQPIQHAEVWKRVYEMMEKTKIIWDFIDSPHKELDQEAIVFIKERRKKVKESKKSIVKKNK